MYSFDFSIGWNRVYLDSLEPPEISGLLSQGEGKGKVKEKRKGTGTGKGEGEG